LIPGQIYDREENLDSVIGICDICNCRVWNCKKNRKKKSLDWYFVTEVDYELEPTVLESSDIRYYRGFSLRHCQVVRSCKLKEQI